MLIPFQNLVCNIVAFIDVLRKHNYQICPKIRFLPIVLSKGRKPRHLMTLEELEHECEIDRRAYAKKKAARSAKEEAKRAEILVCLLF